MTEIELRQVIEQFIKKIAPETNPSGLKEDEPIRQKLGIDSFDFLQLMIALGEHYKINIPEDDYGKIGTMNELILYIKSHH